MSRNKLVFLLVLFCLLAALAPLSDFDLDGQLDSFVTEGLILIPMIGFIAGLFWLWIKLPAAGLAVSQPLSLIIVPPPIQNQ